MAVAARREQKHRGAGQHRAIVGERTPGLADEEAPVDGRFADVICWSYHAKTGDGATQDGRGGCSENVASPTG